MSGTSFYKAIDNITDKKNQVKKGTGGFDLKEFQKLYQDCKGDVYLIAKEGNMDIEDAYSLILMLEKKLGKLFQYKQG